MFGKHYDIKKSNFRYIILLIFFYFRTFKIIFGCTTYLINFYSTSKS